MILQTLLLNIKNNCYYLAFNCFNKTKPFMRWLCLLVFVTSLNFSFAQAKTEIKGVVTDTLSVPLALATVLILDGEDSTYIAYTQADKNGLFSIKDKFSKPVIVKVTYLGYFSFEKKLDPNASTLIDLGNIRLTQINNVLFEVVIKEAKAPLKMRGDTIEYDATTFKVPAGSTVEDLLRKLPGIAVGADGAITSHGQSVNKVTVDGKRFFGDDPTMATKNLPAESVSKVQVFNEKTEQEKLTGLSQEKDTKTMNLELKDEFKKGGFGKIVGGAGIEQREQDANTTDLVSKFEVKGNYNKFNKKEQLSFIGLKNNTGRNGMNWNDYQDFRGQQSWDWNQSEEIFGFGYGLGYRYFGPGGDEESDEFGSSEGYFGDGAAGIPENAQAGVNYNYDFNKLKFTGSYTYKQNNLLSEATRTRQFFLPDNVFFTEDQSTQDRKNGSHRAEFILEKEFDSLNSVILKLRGNAVFTKTGQAGLFNNKSNENLLTSSLDMNRSSDRDNLGWQGVAYYKRKFKNKRRNLGVNFIYSKNERNTDEDLYSKNEFHNDSGIDSLSILDQVIQFNTNIRTVRSSLLYVEPIAKDFSLQFFYNYIQRNDELARDVFDEVQDTLFRNNFYTRNNDHNFGLNKAGSILQFGKNGINVTAGIAVQRISLEGSFQEGNNPFTAIDRSYDNVLGSFSANMQFTGKKQGGLSYTGIIQEPSFRNLSPIVDNSNPFFIRIGNPDLNPEISHRFNLSYRGTNSIKFINYSFNLNYTYFENQHITEQTIDTFLVTTSRYINFKGGQRLYSYLGYGFPIIKNKLTVSLNYNYSYDLSKSLINKVLNDARTNNHNIGLNISLTPNESYSLYLDNSMGYATTEYSIETNQNYNVWSQTYNMQANAKLAYGIFFNGTLNYRIFNNERFNSQYDVPILNASVYKLFLKGDKLEVRISAYDLLNKNISIRQWASVNQITETQTFLVSRYYMLSLSYNIKGIKATVKKSNDWMF